MLSLDYTILAERGSSKPCPICGIHEANQHTLKQSALCDGIINGHITGDRALNVRIALQKNAKHIGKL